MSTKRGYRSERRSQQALETRRAIRSAARILFERDGFAGTTVAAIAAEANVSAPTIYATFGSKGAILREMMDELEELAAASNGDPAAALAAEPDPRRQLAVFVHWIRTLFERGEPLLRASRSAQGDPDVLAMIETGNERRLEGTTMLAGAWHKAGLLRPGLSARRGAENLWLLTSAELYFNAVDVLGWSANVYEKWLVDTATRDLFLAAED